MLRTSELSYLVIFFLCLNVYIVPVLGDEIDTSNLWENRGDLLFAYALNETAINNDISDLLLTREGIQNTVGETRVFSQAYAIRDGLMCYSEAVKSNPFRGFSISIKLIKVFERMVEIFKLPEMDKVLSISYPN